MNAQFELFTTQPKSEIGWALSDHQFID